MWKKLLNQSPSLAKIYRQMEYELISKLISLYKTDITFLNYGYSSPKYANGILKLDPQSEPNRYSIQMYHHIASFFNIKGKSVLEVGSGRGGGADYLVHQFQPKSYTGVDIAPTAIAFCRAKYKNKILNFEQGDAEALRFPKNCFDVVLSVETSHCYPNVDKFFSEVCRVIKPRGKFLIADLRPSNQVTQWKSQIQNAGLKILRQENITPNVFASLQKDNLRKQSILNKLPRVIQKPFADFAGVKGSNLFQDLKTENYKYMFFVCIKN